MDKYQKWSTYTPEETGVVIAYASVYGNTANAADILACRLRDAGIRTAVYDVSVTPASGNRALRRFVRHIVFASTTYNAGIFIRMEELLRDLAAHNFRNRTVAFLENGSWAATSGKLMREIIGSCKDVTMLDATVTIRSALKESQSAEIDALVSAIGATIPMPGAGIPRPPQERWTAVPCTSCPTDCSFSVPGTETETTPASSTRSHS